jgi:dolichol-phosphate mannosyltransferase
MNDPDHTQISEPVLSILLPVRDETINLKVMLKLLAAGLEVSHELLVIYDDPDDESVPVVQQMQPKYETLQLIYNSSGRGVRNAITAGVNAARGNYVVIICADDVGPVLALEDMLDLMDQGCEFVSGTRYRLGGRRFGGSAIGAFLSRLANSLMWKISGLALSDGTTGLKMFRRPLFEKFKLASEPVGWVVTFEMAIKAQLLGLKLGEVPIVAIDRLYGGKSTFQLRSWFVEYFKWFVWGSIKLHKYNQEYGKPLVFQPVKSVNSAPESKN